MPQREMSKVWGSLSHISEFSEILNPQSYLAIPNKNYSPAPRDCQNLINLSALVLVLHLISQALTIPGPQLGNTLRGEVLLPSLRTSSFPFASAAIGPF